MSGMKYLGVFVRQYNDKLLNKRKTIYEFYETPIGFKVLVRECFISIEGAWECSTPDQWHSIKHPDNPDISKLLTNMRENIDE